jgi:hypothetical protein
MKPSHYFIITLAPLDESEAVQRRGFNSEESCPKKSNTHSANNGSHSCLCKIKQVTFETYEPSEKRAEKRGLTILDRMGSLALRRCMILPIQALKHVGQPHAGEKKTNPMQIFFVINGYSEYYLH